MRQEYMTRKPFTDSEFITGLKNNDELILSALYKKFFQVILKHVLHNNGTEDEARDIYQESIIVLYKNAQKPDFVLNCALQTYIFSVARRLWLKQLGKNAQLYRINREDEEEEFTDTGFDADAHEEKELQLEKMQESLEQMGEPCKTLILDFYINQLSMEEIAGKFGYTNSDNAKNQKYKCLQRLKRLFFE